MHSTSGIVVDDRGNLFVADTFNHRVRRITPQGIITTAVKDLNLPNGLALDGNGNLYIADSGNHRICKWSSQGRLITVAGTGRPGLSGDGGPATQAQLDMPIGVALDRKGDLYIADSFNHRIRKDNRNGVITTVVGQTHENMKRGLGDGGPALHARLFVPVALAFDRSGALYIAEENHHRVRKVAPNGIITTFAGNSQENADGNFQGGFSGDGGPAARALLNCPSGLAADSAGDLFITDRVNGRIREVGPNGTIRTIAGNGGGRWWRVLHGRGDYGPPLQANLAEPRGLAIDKQGTLYIADGGNDRVCKILRITDG
jgi:sugar lactone lactonase YvrE